MSNLRMAVGDEAVALRLESHMKYYRPKGWCGPIHEFDFVPFVNASDIPDLRAGRFADKFASKWYVKAAIEDFFKDEAGNGRN